MTPAYAGHQISPKRHAGILLEMCHQCLSPFLIIFRYKEYNMDGEFEWHLDGLNQYWPTGFIEFYSHFCNGSKYGYTWTVESHLTDAFSLRPLPDRHTAHLKIPVTSLRFVAHLSLSSNKGVIASSNIPLTHPSWSLVQDCLIYSLFLV